ncbi:MAG: hypothetical protein KC441_02245 [Anaerolineales bacterium]|nr:hypothetical protein [Anaerolineales bacterium]
MSTGQEKLERDLEILSAMAAGMDDYLKSDILFGRMPESGMPMLTLGGYLMRQHRLLALIFLLSDAERQQLDETVRQFNQALVEKVVRFETKAQHELEARLRQMEEYLRDLRNKKSGSLNYDTAVEPRVMISALLHKLQMAPYKFDEHTVERVALLDKNLRQRWTPGDFIWPEAWQPAYPPDEYWWLYGRPT